MKIELAVRNQGHVPSFKNCKRVVHNRTTKKPFLATKPEVKGWMQRCIQSFESQLFCATLTADAGTLTAARPRSLIVSSRPLDDSRQWISQLTVLAEDVDAGNEGATIIIEEIP